MSTKRRRQQSPSEAETSADPTAQTQEGQDEPEAETSAELASDDEPDTDDVDSSDEPTDFETEQRAADEAAARRREEANDAGAARAKRDAKDRTARANEREQARSARIRRGGLTKARVVGPGSYHFDGKDMPAGTVGMFPTADVDSLSCLEKV